MDTPPNPIPDASMFTPEPVISINEAKVRKYRAAHPEAKHCTDAQVMKAIHEELVSAPKPVETPEDKWSRWLHDWLTGKILEHGERREEVLLILAKVIGEQLR